jgi:hypothetical protein
VDKLAFLIARASAVVGVVLTLVAVLARLGGRHFVGSFESATLLEGGVAAMVLACLAYLAILTEGRGRRTGD